MTPSEQIPLGKRIPIGLHAVSVSLPTMADVVAYEEREPSILAKINAGYPRFVKHECLLRVETFWGKFFDNPEHPVWLTASEKIAHALEKHLKCPESKFLKHQGVSGVRIPNDETLNREAKLFLQHVGGYLCSREAEDYLVANQLLDGAQPESLFEGDSEKKILDTLKPLLGASEPNDIILANSGMNAIYATFQAINEIQSPKPRNSWIKLGWLYADTMHILDKFSPEGCSNIDLPNVFDLGKLEELLSSRPESFAAIVTEAPTNPMIQSMDLEQLRELAVKYGVYLVLDPTICSPANVDLAPYADVLVNSLTKYAANEGDVIMGAINVTDHCLENKVLRDKIRQFADPPYHRNLQRLASQVDGYLPLIERVNASTAQVVDFLESHRGIKKVYWAKENKSKAYFERIARSPDAIGGMISFDVAMDLPRFYDRYRLAKGPSFGIKHSLVCPFMYLAQYEPVSTKQGRSQLEKAGINPDLIRFSIGTEPIEEIIDSLEFALS